MENVAPYISGYGAFLASAIAIYGILRMMYGAISNHGGDPEKKLEINRHIGWGFVAACVGFGFVALSRFVGVGALIIGAAGLVFSVVALFYFGLAILREHLFLSRHVKARRRRQRVAELEHEVFGPDQ